MQPTPQPTFPSVSPMGRVAVTREQIAAALGYSPSYGARLVSVLIRDHGFPRALPGMAGRFSSAAVDLWIAHHAAVSLQSIRATVPEDPASSPDAFGHQVAPAPADVPRSVGRRPSCPASAAMARAFQVIEGGRHDL